MNPFKVAIVSDVAVIIIIKRDLKATGKLSRALASIAVFAGTKPERGGKSMVTEVGIKTLLGSVN
jgi:hypothetical protein